MHGHVSKNVKMHRKPTGGTNKHGKHIIARNKKRKRYARSNRHQGDASQMVTSKRGLMGVGFTQTTTNSLRASSMTKPRTREANTSIKYRSMHRHANRVIQTFDMGLGVQTVTKSIRPRSGPNY